MIIMIIIIIVIIIIMIIIIIIMIIIIMIMIYMIIVTILLLRTIVTTATFTTNTIITTNCKRHSQHTHHYPQANRQTQSQSHPNTCLSAHPHLLLSCSQPRAILNPPLPVLFVSLPPSLPLFLILLLF